MVRENLMMRISSLDLVYFSALFLETCFCSNDIYKTRIATIYFQGYIYRAVGDVKKDIHINIGDKLI